MSRLRAVLVLFAILGFGVAALAGALVLVDGAGGRKAGVIVGSKAFTESIILAEIVSQWLERSNVPVQRNFNLGATTIAFEALRSKAIDMYPEYTGTGLMAILKHERMTDRGVVRQTVRDEFSRRYGIRWLDPLGFDNTYALAMPEALVRRLGVTRISDLLGHPDLRAGFAPEFLARDDGWPGLSHAYGLRFQREPTSMEAGLMYQAASSGQVDVVSAYSTDGRIATQHLVVLVDDRAFFPPYEAAIMVREEALQERPALGAALRALAGIISEDEMRRMNAEVDFGSRSITQVAASFLAEHEAQLRDR